MKLKNGEHNKVDGKSCLLATTVGVVEDTDVVNKVRLNTTGLISLGVVIGGPTGVVRGVVKKVVLRSIINLKVEEYPSMPVVSVNKPNSLLLENRCMSVISYNNMIDEIATNSVTCISLH